MFTRCKFKNKRPRMHEDEVQKYDNYMLKTLFITLGFISVVYAILIYLII